MSKTTKQPLKLASISVRGIVQGVGFRPFVYGLAVKHNLKGWVYNTSEDVKIEVEGKAEAIRQFERGLQTQAPPLAHIETVNIEYNPPRHYKEFEIRNSQTQEGKYQLISPDVATCRACLDEVMDSEDRRFRYPFTNCTNCGPRFTIIEDMPYDRPKTTMSSFQMCSQCQAEYDNPSDRRFHAQPNACPTCGPHVELVDNQGNSITESNPITAASQFLKKGKILAIKGLGGFLLACDATDDTVVKTLRQRKKRSSKPFAVMVAEIEQAKKHCYVSPEEEDLLTSPQSPIVLVKWREESSVSPEVAPNLRFLGVMLPYTPLHHLLLRDTGLPLVMTSGNLSEEPIARDNDEALKRLSSIADYFIIHNRDVYSRYDDSVSMIERGASQLVRRARSYAPYPVRLPFEAKQVLGCGAEEKNTFCMTKDSYAFLSQHIGDMENIETLEHFNDTISLYRRLFRVEPEIVAHDLHPDYLATKYARDLAKSGMNLVPVQHHHAHITSCMADNGLKSKVIGVALDGTGMGNDGNIWGGEFLVADYRNYERVGHLEYLPLPGGAAAIKRPYRTAIGYILTLLGENALNCDLPVMKEADDMEMEVIKRQMERRINSPLTSSMGRLFDAVSALLGIRSEIDYEGQAAVELEMAAHREDTQAEESYPYRILEDEGVRIVCLGDLFSMVIEDLKQDVSRGSISVRFHNTVARMIDEMCRLTADRTGITQVALSGGVFQNRLLLKKTTNLLESSGLQVFIHRQVPCNDGGISLGQAAVANFAL